MPSGPVRGRRRAGGGRDLALGSRRGIRERIEHLERRGEEVHHRPSPAQCADRRSARGRHATAAAVPARARGVPRHSRRGRPRSSAPRPGRGGRRCGPASAPSHRPLARVPRRRSPARCTRSGRRRCCPARRDWTPAARPSTHPTDVSPQSKAAAKERCAVRVPIPSASAYLAQHSLQLVPGSPK